MVAAWLSWDGRVDQAGRYTVRRYAVLRLGSHFIRIPIPGRWNA
ncbi:MAG TPA: hypothetical protein VGG25_10225 [Streptosporangiaceae bacterium]|jgi:hypothetical protein